MKPRALVISSVRPDPNGSGTPRRAFQHLWCLSRGYSVDLVIQPRDGAASGVSERTRELCRLVVELPIVDFNIFRVEPAKGRGATLLRELAGVFRDHSVPYHRTKRLAVQHALAGQLADRYDVMLAFRLDTAWLGMRPLPGCLEPPRRRILDLDDLDSHFLRQHANRAAAIQGQELRLAELVRASQLERIEKRLLRGYDVVTFASPQDVERSARLRPTARVETLANAAAPLDEPLPASPSASPDAPFRLLFLGYMAYLANQDGADYMVREILPRIRETLSAPVSLALVGKDPPARVQALADPPDVVVTGWVEDLVPWYRDAHAVVVPLRIGSGTRIKVIEALNFGRPVVSTSLGVDGLGLSDGVDVLIGDSPEHFAAACCRALSDHALRDSLIANGRRKLFADLSYTRACETLAELIGEPGADADKPI